MRRIILALLTLTVLASLSACHTVKGVGQDVKSAGGAIEDASGKN